MENLITRRTRTRTTAATTTTRTKFVRHSALRKKKLARHRCSLRAIAVRLVSPARNRAFELKERSQVK